MPNGEGYCIDLNGEVRARGRGGTNRKRDLVWGKRVEWVDKLLDRLRDKGPAVEGCGGSEEGGWGHAGRG